ncbi:hypothetical protein KFE98_08425 [bacterium SCSIO 12741]|nr:hypothetical protein KFE98_08425 [bacterium SCSIO 12741]
MKLLLPIIGALALSLSTTSLFAQFYQPEPNKARAAMEDRVLLVEAEDFECIANLEEVFPKYWKLHEKIWFKSASEISEILRVNEPNKFMVLTADDREEVKVSQKKYQYAQVFAFVLYPGERANRRNDNVVERDFVAKISFPSCITGEPELKFLSESFQKVIEERAKVEDTGKKMKRVKVDYTRTLKVKEQKLLIPKEGLSVPEDQIATYYPYPYEVVPAAELYDRILKGEAGSLYPDILWSDSRFRWSIMLIDLGDYQVSMDARIQGYKENMLKKNYDPKTEYLALLRGKIKIDITTLKYLAKEVVKAEQKAASAR